MVAPAILDESNESAGVIEWNFAELLESTEALAGR